MIVLIFFLTTLGAVSAQYPDYYAVRTGSDDVYKVFTKRMNCTDPVYVHDYDKRVLLKVQHKWIIGSLDDAETQCQNIDSAVKKEYESTTDGKSWRNIRESNSFHKMLAFVELKSLNKCEEIPGLRLDNTLAWFHMEDCESKDYWAINYHDRTVFVSIIAGASQCSFDTRKDARLVEDISAKLFIYSSCPRDEKEKPEVQHRNNVGKGQDYYGIRSNFENGRVKEDETDDSKEEQTSPKKGNLSAVICICTALGLLIALVIIAILVKRRKAKANEERLMK